LITDDEKIGIDADERIASLEALTDPSNPMPTTTLK